MSRQLEPSDSAGLSFLISHAIESRKICYAPRHCVERAYELTKHPFGLTVPTDQNEPAFLPKRIHFLGYPGYTDSIKTMAAWISIRLAEGFPVQPLCYLRVIVAAYSPRFPNNHDVYYEIGLGSEVFICGGCTDCSGAGKVGKWHMDSLFGLLARLSGVTVETVSLPMQQARAMRDNLLEQLDAQDSTTVA